MQQYDPCIETKPARVARLQLVLSANTRKHMRCTAKASHAILLFSAQLECVVVAWRCGLSGNEIELCALGGLDERFVEARTRLEYRLVCTQRQAGQVGVSEVFMYT
jgi:hypothetical protein